MSNDYSDITNYEFKKDIGEGNFGKVKLGIFKPTGEEFAIKVLNKEKIRKKMKNLALRENEIITKLNHINIVLVYSIIDTKEDYFIIMEYCKLGELFDYIVKYKRLSEEEASNFFYQLINGVEYIHSQGIAHRDLKPENLLLTEDKVLKIIDFGLSHEFEEEEFLKTKCGSPSYAAPEIISKPNYNGFKIDVWCCGIILYAMLCGYLPFDGDDDAQNNNVKLFQNILECEPELPDFLSNISKDLIMRILNPDPDKRITIEQIKKHPFYLKGKGLCSIDYSLKEQEIIKTKESFFKHAKEDNSNNNDDSLKENDNYLNKNNSESANKISSKNYKINKTDGNIKSNGKNSLDIFTNNKYKLTINVEGRNNNNLISIENLNKVTKQKLQLISLKSKNKQKNELNYFKKKFNPINLHIQKKLNTKIQNILNTEGNENAKHGLPFIGQKDYDNMFNYFLANKLKFRLDNSSNNSINLIKNSEESTNVTNNKTKFGPHSKKNHIFIENKLNNNNDVFDNIKKNLDINKMNINSHKDIKISDIHKTKMKSSERIKRNFNLQLNNINTGSHRKNTGNMTNTINTYIPGKLTLSLSSENKINRKNKIYKNKYNYDYNYNFNSSPKKNVYMNNTPVETLNVSNDINHVRNRNFNNREAKTIAPFNDNNSKRNIINTSPTKEKFGNLQSSEMKTLGNNQNINNIGEILSTKNKDNLKFNFMREIKFNNIINLPKENSDNKLYMLTEENIPNTQNIKSKVNSKNYIVNSERSDKRNGISLPKGVNKDKKYNLTKVIQNVQSDKLGMKKNKSFGHNSIDEEVQNKQNRNMKKFRIRKGSNDKIKNREDLLRYALFHGNKNHKYSNFNNLITLNNNLLPKLNDHMYNIKNEKSK
jgi:serine/threonine protein kinase